MTTTILILSVITWGIGMLSWAVYMGYKSSKWKLEIDALELSIKQKTDMFDVLASMNSLRGGTNSKPPSAPRTPTELPEKLKELMKSSPLHPEVEEIEPSDSIIGVRFGAENYPPGFEDDDE